MPNLGDDRIDSWKDIAGYLQRDMRTVRRWESTKGLPVHRVPGGERRAVFAYRGEIDTWLRETDKGAISWVMRGEDCEPPRTGAAHSTVSVPWPWVRVVVGMLAVVAIVTPFVLRARKGPADRRAGSEVAGPVITSVTAIRATARQTIIIRGRSFGRHAPYANTDACCLAIRDKSAHWAAGRIIPDNWDEVMLSVESWDDTEIVVGGFTGAYGAHGWELSAGDRIEIGVWNPKTGAGPALYGLKVESGSAE